MYLSEACICNFSPDILVHAIAVPFSNFKPQNIYGEDWEIRYFFPYLTLKICTVDNKVADKNVKPPPVYLRWPHMQANQVQGLSLREIGGGFTKHHRAPSIRSACYAIAKPSTMVQRMQNSKKLRGHRVAVYCGMA